MNPSTDGTENTEGTESTADTGERDPARLGYEAARDELVDIVRRLESGGTELEESLGLWERGEALAARCQDVLDGALRRLDDAAGGGAGP